MQVQRHRKKRGQALIEMIFSIIMFVLLIAIITSVSVYLYVQHAIITAARDGARIAALNEDIGDTLTANDGIEEVEDYVVNMVATTTGIQINEENVFVDPPDPADPVGERSVVVEVDFELQNPVPVAAFLSALTGDSHSLDEIPIHGEATMRYEE